MNKERVVCSCVRAGKELFLIPGKNKSENRLDDGVSTWPLLHLLSEGLPPGSIRGRLDMATGAMRERRTLNRRGLAIRSKFAIFFF